MLKDGPTHYMDFASEVAPLAALIVLAVLAAAAVRFYLRKPREKPDVRQVAGSRIAVSISDRFAHSDRFSGFIHGESGASIVFMELPAAAFDQMKDATNASAMFEQQGISNVTPRELAGRTGDYIYLQGEQKTALVDYVKYILIFQEEGLTGMVTANIPSAAFASGLIASGEIEMLMTSAHMASAAPSHVNLFTLSYLGAFEEDLSLLGTAKGYRLKDPALAPAKADGVSPLFLVAPSLTPAPIPNLSFFAERSFEGIARIDNKIVETSAEVDVAGLHAVEIVGHGTDSKNGDRALLYQLIVEAPKGGYFRLLGMAQDSERERFLGEFRKMATSFKSDIAA